MIKEIKIIMMLAFCCVSYLNSMNLSESEQQFVNRHVEKHEIALQDFSALLKKYYEGDLDNSSSEAKCLRSARMAAIDPKFSWGFKWLVPFVATLQIDKISRSDYEFYLDRFLGYKDKECELKDTASMDMVALKNKMEKAAEFKLTPISETFKDESLYSHWIVYGMQTTALGPKRFQPKQSYGAHSSELVDGALYCVCDRTSIDKRATDLQTHVRKQFTPKHDGSKFQLPKAAWGAIKIKETVAQHLAKLKADNPVDKNPATNKIAKLFDRIA